MVAAERRAGARQRARLGSSISSGLARDIAERDLEVADIGSGKPRQGRASSAGFTPSTSMRLAWRMAKGPKRAPGRCVVPRSWGGLHAAHTKAGLAVFVGDARGRLESSPGSVGTPVMAASAFAEGRLSSRSRSPSPLRQTPRRLGPRQSVRLHQAGNSRENQRLGRRDVGSHGPVLVPEGGDGAHRGLGLLQRGRGLEGPARNSIPWAAASSSMATMVPAFSAIS